MLAFKWDTNRYQSQHSFVWQYGSSTIDDLLDLQPGETVLDVGCGTGELTAQIQETCDDIKAIGIDADPEMISKAQVQYSNVKFVVADARNFGVNKDIQKMGKFDAVFSNAALHWVPEAEKVVQSIAKVLKPGGRLVAEFGGRGNVKELAAFLDGAASRYSDDDNSRNPWYFPSISEYSALLEQHGIEVVFAKLYDRPTPLEGKDGLRNWILMFGNPFLRGLSSSEIEKIIQEAEKELKPRLHDGSQWLADYRRIRVVAKKM